MSAQKKRNKEKAPAALFWSVTTIGNGAFRECSSLRTITLPASVSTIENYAFESCSSLEKVFCKAKTPPTLTQDYYGYSIFKNNAPNRYIYVPTNSVDDYKTAVGWSNYANYIVDSDFK